MIYVVGLIVVVLFIIGAIVFLKDDDDRWLSALFVMIAIIISVPLAVRFDATQKDKAHIAAIQEEIDMLNNLLKTEDDSANRKEIIKMIEQKIKEKTEYELNH